MHTGRVAAVGNSTRRIKGHPPTSHRAPNAFCKMLICSCLRPQRDGSPCNRPRTRHHRVFGSRSRDEMAAPPSPATPAPAGEGPGTGVPRLPLAKESVRRPKTKHKQMENNKKNQNKTLLSPSNLTLLKKRRSEATREPPRDTRPLIAS